MDRSLLSGTICRYAFYSWDARCDTVIPEDRVQMNNCCHVDTIRFWYRSNTARF